MSNEIRTTYATGETVYGCVFRPSDGKVWYVVGEVFETWGTASRIAADYKATTIDEVASGSGYYVGDFPTAITTATTYDVQLRVQSGAQAVDADDIISIEEVIWSGTSGVIEQSVPATATSLGNYALSKIGGGGAKLGNFRIESLYDGSATANLLLMLYPQIKKEVLSRAWWSEATKYADLGAETDVTRAGWDFAFNLPSDYLGRAEQIPETLHRSTKARFTFQYDKEIVQGRLFTNQYSNEAGDSAYIRYIWNLNDVSKFSPLLHEAIATKWAAEVSGPLIADGGQRRRELLVEYEVVVLGQAEGENAMQNGDDDSKGRYTAIEARTD